RYFHVTGVETCALPIFDFSTGASFIRNLVVRPADQIVAAAVKPGGMRSQQRSPFIETSEVRVRIYARCLTCWRISPTSWHGRVRSEERRVGKECKRQGR